MAEEDLGKQLKIQQEINSVLAKRQKMLLDQVQALGAQAKMAKEVCNGLECKQLDGMEERIKKIDHGLKEVKGRTEELNESLDQTSQNAEKASKGFFNMSNAIKSAALVGFAGGVVSAFKGAFAIITNVVKAVGTLIGAFVKLTKTILSIPFQIMEGLAKMAAKTHDMLVPVREAIQDIAREFGNLASGEGKAVKGSLEGIQKNSKALAKAGLSMGSMYGLDEQGAAAKFKAFNEAAKAAGGAISLLAAELEDNQILLDAYRRGLGLTAEQQMHMGAIAVSQGKTMVQANEEFAASAEAARRATGISSKVIGKAMGEMISNFEEFGEMGPDAMAKNAAFARKLGIEIKALQGLLKFDNFETAAKSAAKLAGAFGINVDAMKLMRTQDPAERLQYLQEQFKKSGKSIEGMGRIARRNLGAALGDMDQKTIALAFSNRGLSMSYDDIKNAVKDKKKEGKSTEQILASIAKNIAKVVHQMEKQFKGFFDAFSSGFLDGIFRSKEMRGMLVNLAQALRMTFYAGREVGKMFMALFPGVSDMAGALREFFEPKTIGVLLKGVKEAFRMLFIDLQADPNSGFDSFIMRIKHAFSNFFSQKGFLFQILQDGAKTALTALSGLAAQLVDYVVPEITKGLGYLADFLRTGSFDNLREVGGWWTDIMDPLLTSLENNLPLLGTALGEFFTVAWELSKPHVMAGLKEFGKWLLYYMGAVITFSVGKAVVSAVLAGVVSTMLFGGAPGMAITQTAEMRTVIGALATMSAGEVAKAAINLAIIGGVFMTALGLVTIGIAKLISALSVPIESVGAAAVALVGMSFSVALLGGAAAKIGMLPEPLIMKSVGAMAVLSLVVVKLGLIAVAIGHMSKGIDLKGVLGFMGIMTTMVGSIVVLATSAMAIGLVIAKTMGVAAGLMAVGLKTLAVVALAISGFAVAFIFAFSRFSVASIEKASKAAKLTVKIMETTVMTVGALMSAGIKTALVAIISGKDPITDGLRMLKGVTDTMLEFLPAIITNIVSAIEGKDPAETKLAVETVEKVMKALEPMINVTATMGQVAAGLTSAQRKNPIDPADIRSVLETVNEGMRDVFGGIQDVVTTIVSSLTDLTPAQIKSAEAAAPLMKAAGAMLSAIMAPVQVVLKNSRDVRTIMTEEGGMFSYADYDTRDFGISASKVRDTMKALGETLPGVMTSMGAAVTSIMTALKEFTISESEGKNISRVAKIMKPAGESILSISQAMTGFMKMIQSLGGENWNDAPILHKSINRIGAILTGGSGWYRHSDGSTSDYNKSEGLLPIIKGMLTFFDGVEIKSDPSVLKNKSEAIAATMTALGSVTNAMGKAMAVLAGNSKKGAGNYTSRQIKGALENVKQIMTGLLESGFGDSGFLKDLMDKIYSFGDDKFGRGGFKKVKFVAKKAKMLTGLIDVIPVLTNMVSQVKGMKRMLEGPNMSFEDPAIMSSEATNPIQDLWDTTISKFFESSSGGKGPLELIMDSIIGLAATVGNPKELKNQVSAIKESFEAIGTMSGILQRFGIDPEEGSKKTSNFTQASIGAARLNALLLNPSFNSVIGKVKDFAGGGKAALPKTSQSRLAVKRIKAAAKVFSQIDKVLSGKSKGGEFSELINNPKKAEVLAKNITKIDSAFKKAGGIKTIAGALDGGGKILVEHQAGIEVNMHVFIDTNQLVGKLFNVVASGEGNSAAAGQKIKFQRVNR